MAPTGGLGANPTPVDPPLPTFTVYKVPVQRALRPRPITRAPRMRNPVTDPLDVSLEDYDLMHEVELLTSLIMAANASQERLDQEQIDELLGVEPPAVPRQRHRGDIAD